MTDLAARARSELIMPFLRSPECGVFAPWA
jgi:hypothetical protein